MSLGRFFEKGGSIYTPTKKVMGVNASAEQAHLGIQLGRNTCYFNAAVRCLLCLPLWRGLSLATLEQLQHPLLRAFGNLLLLSWRNSPISAQEADCATREFYAALLAVNEKLVVEDSLLFPKQQDAFAYFLQIITALHQVIVQKDVALTAIALSSENQDAFQAHLESKGLSVFSRYFFGVLDYRQCSEGPKQKTFRFLDLSLKLPASPPPLLPISEPSSPFDCEWQPPPPSTTVSPTTTTGSPSALTPSSSVLSSASSSPSSSSSSSSSSSPPLSASALATSAVFLEHCLSLGLPACTSSDSCVPKVSVFPPVLILRLNRTHGLPSVSTWNRSRVLKDAVAVVFPLGLSLGDSIYDLVAVLGHVGQHAGQGHYIVHARAGDNWRRFDDSKVEDVPAPREGSVASSEAYVLFYQRQNFTVRDVT